MKKRLLNDDYTLNDEGLRIHRQFTAIIEEFVNGIGDDVDLADIFYACDNVLEMRLKRRIIMERPGGGVLGFR